MDKQLFEIGDKITYADYDGNEYTGTITRIERRYSGCGFWSQEDGWYYHGEGFTLLSDKWEQLSNVVYVEKARPCYLRKAEPRWNNTKL